MQMLKDLLLLYFRLVFNFTGSNFYLILFDCLSSFLHLIVYYLFDCEWEVKGKDPDACRSEVKNGFNKG